MIILSKNDFNLKNEETSFIKKENKTLITPRSRRSKSRNKETEVDNESEDVLSDHIGVHSEKLYSLFKF